MFGGFGERSDGVYLYNSSLKEKEKKEILQKITEGKVRILFLAPEQLEKDKMRQALKSQ